MKAELTIRQLYYNPSILDFFFRTQSRRHFEELVEKSTEDSLVTLQRIEDNAEWDYEDLDELEEDFYDMSVEELAEQFGIDLQEEEEDEE